MSTEEVMIPTAEDLLSTIMSYLKIDYSIDELRELDPDLVPELIEEINSRTRLHVEVALKKASEKVSLTDFASEFLQEGSGEAIDKNSIINSYPLTNIN